MGLFSKPKPPTPTDPTTVINAQNQQTGQAGGATQAQKIGGAENQFGTQLSYQDTGQKDSYGNPIYSQSTSFGQPTQQFNNGLMGLGGQYINRAQNMLNNPTNLSPGDFGQAQQYATATLGHQQDLQADRLRNQLSNQGLAPDSDAYKEAVRAQTAGFGDAMNNAMNPIQNQLFNQNLQAAQFGTNQLTQLANPGLQAGFQGMNAGVNPQATSTYNPTNAQGAYQTYDQQQQQQYQNQIAQQNGMLGAGGQLLGLTLGGPAGGYIGKGLGSLGGYAMGGFGSGSMGAAG